MYESGSALGLVLSAVLLCHCGGEAVARTDDANHANLECHLPDTADPSTVEGRTALACGGDCLPAICRSGNCSPAAVAEVPWTPIGLAHHSDYLFFSAKGDHVIRRINVADHSTEDVVSVAGYPNHLAVIDGRLYWTSWTSIEGWDGGEVASMALPSGPIVQLAKGTMPRGVAVTADRVFWAEFASGVRAIPHIGGAPSGDESAFGGYENAAGVWVHGNTLFWTQMNGDNSIRAKSISGKASESLLSCYQVWPDTITADDDRVYWINKHMILTTGTIMALDRAVGRPAVLADGRTMPHGITGDTHTLYWVENGTRIMKMLK